MASLKAGIAKSRWMELGFEAPTGLQAVAAFESFRAAGEPGLAILAMGCPYWTFLHEGIYILCVQAEQADAVQRELAELARLNRPPRGSAPLEYREFRVRPFSFILYALVLIAFFVAQPLFDLLPLGRADAQLMVGQGQWWRALTALSLHADVVHLVSNLVAGLGFAFFVARFFGAAAGWGLILLSGFFGNVLNALVYYPQAHFSIGASTAVFGGLGLLSGVGIWMALFDAKGALGLPRWLLPLFAGLTLLGLIGVGDGVTVDVAAHISGFVCGLFWGIFGACFQRAFVRLERYALLLGSLSLLVLAGAWALAWTAG